MSSGGEVSRSTLRNLMGLQDLMALLMVVATTFTGYATWKYVQVSRAVFRSAERPYLGVNGIRVDQTDPTRPLLVIEYRDFSSIPADRSVLSVRPTIDGRPFPNEQEEPIQLGILSPQVSHFWHMLIPTDSVRQILDGKALLSLTIAFSYGDTGDDGYCYRMKFEYDPKVRDFTPAGGSDRCSH